MKSVTYITESELYDTLNDKYGTNFNVVDANMEIVKGVLRITVEWSQ